MAEGVEVHYYSKLIRTIGRVWRLKVAVKRFNPATAARIINPPRCSGTFEKAYTRYVRIIGL